jgi:hypothetical protein
MADVDLESLVIDGDMFLSISVNNHKMVSCIYNILKLYLLLMPLTINRVGDLLLDSIK